MTPENTPNLELTEQAYAEGKDEVKFVDRLLEAWLYLSRHTGLPVLETRCPLGAMIKRDPADCAVEARARVMDLTDSQFLAIDQAVARLPAPLRRVVFVEYWQSGSARQKARRMRPALTHLEYRQRLNAAQWALYVALLPDVERWRALSRG